MKAIRVEREILQSFDCGHTAASIRCLYSRSNRPSTYFFKSDAYAIRLLLRDRKHTNWLSSGLLSHTDHQIDLQSLAGPTLVPGSAHWD